MHAMAEPHATEFRRLLYLGAGACDVHGAKRQVGFARRTKAKEAFVARELARVERHREHSCRLLEEFVATPARHILEVGCSTGGLAVALAQSSILAPDKVVGLDPDALSLRAAEVRARGHGLGTDRVAFLQNRPGHPLPVAEGYDLVLCVSVLEFVPTADERKRLIYEMKRLLKPGGYLFLSTPNPFRLRDLHAGRWLGDVVRRDGYPWATPPWVLRSMVSDFSRVPTDRWVSRRALERLGLRITSVPRPIARAVVAMHRWQKLLVRKPPDSGSDRARLTGRTPAV
jgi:2-polyprenyl-3-methyl-5-hydroxy-6-metoxy-1,4-benzoquinol methylase